MILAIRILMCFLGAIFLCNIDPAAHYGWLSGAWHGLFFVFNWVRSLFSDVLFKAETHTGAYDLFFWIFAAVSVITVLTAPFLYLGKDKEEKA